MISLENLKADEANILNNIAQCQGALTYNRQLQEFLKREEEKTAAAASAAVPPIASD